MSSKEEKVLKLFLFAFIGLMNVSALASSSKIDLLAGYFSLNAKVEENSTKISNPSIFSIGYLRPFADQYEAKVGYTILSSDFSGSDLGYGLNAGINYFPWNSAHEEKFSDQNAELRRYEDIKPFASIGFYQRSFQAVKISYAGLGAGIGVEKYYNRQFNLKAELRYITLSGSSDSTVTETDLLIGIVYKI